MAASLQPQFLNSSQKGHHGIECLPHDVLRLCFEFVGPGQYRFIAGVNRSFQLAYKDQHGGRYKTRTSAKNAMSSVSLAQMYMEDTQPTSNELAYVAARHGSLHVVRWLREIKGVAFDKVRARKFCGSSFYVQTACDAAAKGGNLKCLKYLEESAGCTFGESACMVAAQGGHLDCLRYLREKGCPWDTETCQVAAMYNRLTCLQFAIQNGCPMGRGTCIGAALGGHLQCLQYARNHGCPWDKLTMEAAARRGHLHILQYAKQQGCPWDEGTCTMAAAFGQLECLRYAREHGCSWSRWTCVRATECGNLDCLRYARENGCPIDLEECKRAARLHGHHSCEEYLRQSL